MSLKAELETWASALKAYDDEDLDKALNLFGVRSFSLPLSPGWDGADDPMVVDYSGLFQDPDKHGPHPCHPGRT